MSCFMNVNAAFIENSPSVEPTQEYLSSYSSPRCNSYVAICFKLSLGSNSLNNSHFHPPPLSHNFATVASSMLGAIGWRAIFAMACWTPRCGTRTLYISSSPPQPLILFINWKNQYSLWSFSKYWMHLVFSWTCPCHILNYNVWHGEHLTTSFPSRSINRRHPSFVRKALLAWCMRLNLNPHLSFIL